MSAHRRGPRKLTVMPFRERLSVPLLWWVITALFAFSLLLAFVFYLGPWWGAGAALACLLVMGAVFVCAAAVIEVTATELVVGRSRIDLEYLAGCHALDEAQTKRRAGVEADARAFLVLRPYVSTAVEITLDDPDDPVPYWLVSSRRPRALASALSIAISSRVTG
jgi:Protein of unknown function (DUF3093)